MTTDNIEEVLTCFGDDDAEWTLMPTGEVFHGKEEVRKLAEHAISGRTHTKELGIHPRCVFVNAEGTNMCWEYVHTGIATRRPFTVTGVKGRLWLRRMTAQCVR
jgi:hypothetical protein